MLKTKIEEETGLGTKQYLRNTETIHEIICVLGSAETIFEVTNGDLYSSFHVTSSSSV